jgi:phospholipase/carboxylesterase
VRNAGGFWTAAPATGTIDHVAVRAKDVSSVDNLYHTLEAEGAGDINVHDRHYFYSLYVREPGGTLIEVATDAPGFTADETLETLGTELFIPKHFKADHAALKVMLPQFGLPGEERVTYRDLPFVHRIHMPENWDGTVLVLLHGSGTNETAMLPLGRKVAPNAMLIGLRGRSTDEGSPRFFRRLSQTTFDQKEIASEVEAFVAFIEDIGPAYGVDPARTAFLGYSNGGNMLGATMQLRPEAIAKAILLRSMNVLEERPAVDLSRTQVLSLSATDDFYGPLAGELEDRLRSAGAELTAKVLDANHGLGTEDEVIVRAWLAERIA